MFPFDDFIMFVSFSHCFDSGFQYDMIQFNKKLRGNDYGGCIYQMWTLNDLSEHSIYVLHVVPHKYVIQQRFHPT